MHLNRFFSAKAYLKCVSRRKNFRSPFFPCQSLLLSTNELNNNYSFKKIFKGTRFTHVN